MAPVEAPDDPVFSDGRIAERLEKRDFRRLCFSFPSGRNRPRDDMNNEVIQRA